ncbi:MAG: DUF4981 domain-containing protein [Acidimicrobiia bacterium]|nr:DUF4981 domain-containing protein [Acidimicrobiia bacterium]
MSGALHAGRAWTDPQVVAVGRLAARAPLVPFPDVAGARTGDPAGSPWWLSLDGPWLFRRRERPEAVTAADLAPAPDGGGPAGRWTELEVPGSWVLAGWDHPIYTNVRMPFGGVPPHVPAANPTGVHRRTVVIPARWRGRRVILSVGSAESVLYVHVNGTFVGMSTDSRLPAEFDITAYVTPGEQATIVCTVVRFSAGSWIEDQDDWWMGGLQRSVTLWSPGATSLADVHCTAGFDPATGDGTLVVTADVVFSARPERGWTVEAVLETSAGRRVARAAPPVDGADMVPVDPNPYLFGGHRVRLEVDVPQVEPWSAEIPTLHRVVTSLVDPSGTTVEVVAQRVGFRSVIVGDRELRINGAPVTIWGMNRHDHHPDRGKSMTTDDLRADLVAMKQANVNAIRCAHYPPDTALLDLCDELGLYVVDEANVESHAVMSSLCHDPRYATAIVERVRRMVLRDRTHPSVVAWSLGNESGYGAAHDAAAAWVRRVDPTRPLHYEGAIMGNLDAEAPVTDIVCPMYASVADIVAWAERGLDRRRPLILCEYSHAMGNSNGGLADYAAAFEHHHGLQGGFIWEWKDHGLRQRLDDGRERFAYGGQFGDEPNDGNFVADGIVGPDLTPHPALGEFRYLARPVAVSVTPALLRRWCLRVTNRQWFADTSWLRARWELVVDGRIARRGRLELAPLAPRTTGEVELPVGPDDLPTDGEVYLTVRWATRRTLPWADSGTEVAWDQVVLRRRPPEGRMSFGPAPSHRRRRTRPVEVSGGSSTGAFEVWVGDTAARFDTALGLVQVDHQGRPLFDRPPGVTVWRAPTDNDGFKVWVGSDDPWHLLDQDRVLARWLAWGLDRLEVGGASVTVSERGADHGVVVSERRHLWAPGAEVAISHRREVAVEPSGWITVTERVDVPDVLDDLPRVGSTLSLVSGYDTVTWCGLGPHENYPDRRAATVVGTWRRPIGEMQEGYLMPQTSGARGGLRWARVEPASEPAGDGRLALAPPTVTLQAAADPALHLGIGRHDEATLWAARDRTELPDDQRTHVHLDVALRGLGTASCGPDTDSRHRVRPGRHRWRWRLGVG